jgi:uncharacterized protein
VATALVTGASAGLGAEFAAQLAARGYDLVLVARDENRLRASAEDLSNVSAEILPADLTTDDGCAAVANRITDASRPVDMLINNAGIGTYRAFGTASLEAEEHQLDLNVRAVLRLTHAAVRAMTGRGSGRIVNISSVSGFVPRAGNATYSAGKAWVTMFTEALAIQLADSGVTATAICPGFTHTEFHQRAKADMSHVPERMWLDAEQVVREGLADAFKGKPVSVPSRQYRRLLMVVRVVPRPLVRRVMARRNF